MDLSSLLFARVSFLFRNASLRVKNTSEESVSLSFARARRRRGFFFLLGKVVFRVNSSLFVVVVVLSRERKMKTQRFGFKKEKK